MAQPRSSERPKILVYAPDPDQARRYEELILQQEPDLPVVRASTADEARAHIADAEILFGWQVPKDVLRSADGLKWMHNMGAGVEGIVSPEVLPPEVVLSRTDGTLLAARMAEYVLGAVYQATQKFRRAWLQQLEGTWQQYANELAAGKTVGVAGLGDIGRVIARKAVENDMRVVGWKRSPASLPDVERVYAGRDQLTQFVGACDFVVLVLPLTAETREIIDAQVLAAMRSDAHLINVGRGAVIDERALAEALQREQIAGAVLDVFATEPLAADHPFWGLSNVTITPHISGPIVPEEVTPMFLDNLRRYRSGEPLLRVVDREKQY